MAVMDMQTPKCVECKTQECYDGKDCYDIADDILKEYTAEDLKSMRISGKIETDHYMKKTRLEEIIQFADDFGWKRLGIAFCVGLTKEAEILEKILSDKGFDVFSVICKVGGIDKRKLDIPKLHPEMENEATCNPIAQAKLLNEAGTDMNIIIGLCIGHDMLFTKYSDAPVTTFIVKDRVLSHNPAGAITSSYYLKNRFGLSD